MQLQQKKPRITNRSRNGSVNSQTIIPQKSFALKSQQLNFDVKQCIERIILKMQNSKVQTLHPPYFQKTLTKYRQQSYSHKLGKQIQTNLSSQNQNDFKTGIKTLDSFISNFDEEYIDVYLEQIRQPYIRKIFNQGYQIDKVNFKRLNSQYQLRKQIQEVLSQTSEWLLQIQLLQDILNRIQLYFNVKTQSITELLKAQGAEDRKGTWIGYFKSLMKKTTSYALRKGAKIAQNTGYATVLTPALAMLTWAVVGGTSSTFPWKGSFDIKAAIIPIVAFTVPYMLDSMAQSVQKNDFKCMLQNWATQFERINESLRHFNQMLLKQINNCSQAGSKTQYLIHATNLRKFVENLSKQIDNVSNYDQKIFEQMKQRTKAYYTNYIELNEGQWTTILTPEQYQKHEKYDSL